MWVWDEDEELNVLLHEKNILRKKNVKYEKAFTLQENIYHINMVTGQICSKIYAYLQTSVISISDRTCFNNGAEICSQLPELLQITPIDMYERRVLNQFFKENGYLSLFLVNIM